MRLARLWLILSLVQIGCGGRSVSKDYARELIARIPQESLEKDDVDVQNVTQLGKQAVVETRLRTAFRLQEVEGKWVIREIRLGHGQWQSIDILGQALERVKIDETRKMLDEVAQAIEKYRAVHYRLPDFKDYISLSDLLSPQYMTSLIRLDAWRNPLAAEHAGPNSIVLASAGPDGKFGTADDIKITL